MVVPPLASALWDAANANDEASEASKRHAEAVKALRDAVERLNGQQATRNHNTRQGIQDDLDAAEAARQHEIRVRGLLDAQLQQQRAELRASETASRTAIGGTVPGAAGFAADVRAGAARDQIAAIEGALKINDGKRADAERAIATGRRLLVMRQIAGETDKASAANQRYEDTIDRLSRQFEAGKISENTFHRLATDADTAKKKALELAEAGKKVVNEFGREVTSAQASAIARAAGLTVNSADRSIERQRQLYNAWVAAGKPSDNPVAKPGSSAHNRGNALDIQMSAGVTVAKIKSAFEAEGVRLTKIITERGHWHIEWARTAAQKQADKDMAKDARDAAAAHRELQSDVDGLIKLLDPARAAGDAYAQTLLTIAKAEQAGMLTQGEALGYRLTAAQQERNRRGKELVQASTAMFGGEDPLKDLLDRGQREKEQQVDLWNTNRERGMESYRSVADFYLNAMNGGTRSIWDLFRQNGLRVLSELLAKWTVGQSGGGGGLLKLLGLTGSASGAVDAGGVRAGANSALDAIPRNATGTEYFPGGMSVVGEFGKELVSLPRGSRVTPAAETRRMLAGNDNGRRMQVEVVPSDYFDVRVREVASPVAQAHAEAVGTRAVAGSVALSQAETRATSARRLGRRW